MSNYRFIMRTEGSVVSNEDGRLVLEDRDEWSKTEYGMVLRNMLKVL